MTKGFTELVNQQLDDRLKTYSFWKSLKKANSDYLKIDVAGDGTFVEFMKYNYGVQLYTDTMGNYTSKFDVIDEHQYLMFMLKYA